MNYYALLMSARINAKKTEEEKSESPRKVSSWRNRTGAAQQQKQMEQNEQKSREN